MLEAFQMTTHEEIMVIKKYTECIKDTVLSGVQFIHKTEYGRAILQG